ncbi:DUF1311 domain-containing protein [Bacillus sp. NP157]|nr:DUF1311 domain-containing protein [Bacillus sp. NP157]
MKTFATVVALCLVAMPTIVSAFDDSTEQALRHSAPKGITEAFFACTKKTGFDKAELSNCISTELKVQDRRLNKAYSALMTHLDDKSKASLRAAERAWLDFNVKSITAETDIGGTNQTTDLDVAQAELYRYCDRANVLERYLFGLGL